MPVASTAVKKSVLSEVRKHVKMTLVLDSRKLFTFLHDSDEIIKKNWHNIDTYNLQKFSSHRLFKLFAANDSSFSSSLGTHVHMLSDDFRVTAYKRNKSLYTEGQEYIDGLLERLNYLDTFDGFAEPNTIADQIAKMGRNILTSDNAAGAIFVNLDKGYEVHDFQILDCDRVYFD